MSLQPCKYETHNFSNQQIIIPLSRENGLIITIDQFRKCDNFKKFSDCALNPSIYLFATKKICQLFCKKWKVCANGRCYCICTNTANTYNIKYRKVPLSSNCVEVFFAQQILHYHQYFYTTSWKHSTLHERLRESQHFDLEDCLSRRVFVSLFIYTFCGLDINIFRAFKVV